MIRFGMLPPSARAVRPPSEGRTVPAPAIPSMASMFRREIFMPSPSARDDASTERFGLGDRDEQLAHVEVLRLELGDERRQLLAIDFVRAHAERVASELRGHARVDRRADGELLRELDGAVEGTGELGDVGEPARRVDLLVVFFGVLCFYGVVVLE